MGVSPGGGRHRPPEAGEIRKADGPGLRVVHPVLQRSGAIQINSRAKTAAPERFQTHGRLRCGNARRAREAFWRQKFNIVPGVFGASAGGGAEAEAAQDVLRSALLGKTPSSDSSVDNTH